MNGVVVGVGGPGDEALAIDDEAASVRRVTGRARRIARVSRRAGHASEREGEQQREQSRGGLSHRREHDSPGSREVSATSEPPQDRPWMKDSVGWARMAPPSR